MVKLLCGGLTYTASQFCCGEAIGNSATKFCCGGAIGNKATQLCQGNTTTGTIVPKPPAPPSRPTCPTIPTRYENVEGAAELVSWLNNLDYNNITVRQEGGVVIVESTGGSNQIGLLTLDIPDGVKVEWGIGGWSVVDGQPVLTLRGSGTLELTSAYNLQHSQYGAAIFIESGSPTLVIRSNVLVRGAPAIRTAPGSSPNIFLSNASGVISDLLEGTIVLLGGGNIIVTGNTEITSIFGPRIYRGPSATVNGFYDNNTNKAHFNGGSWADGVNLFPK
jgi:hypothetical protein